MDIAVGSPGVPCDYYGQLVVKYRQWDTLAVLHPDLPNVTLDDASLTLIRRMGVSFESRNREVHLMLLNGVGMEYLEIDRRVRVAQGNAIDFDDSYANDLHAVNQSTVTENRNTPRPDVVLFVNGLLLGMIEVEGLADENSTMWTARQPLQTCKLVRVPR